MDGERPVTPRVPRILACVLCQQRKIRCDRASPCSNCEKTGAICIPSTPAPARKTRRTNRDLRERLAKCEALLEQYAPSTPPTGSSASTPSISVANIPSIDDLTEKLAGITHEDIDKQLLCRHLGPGELIVEEGNTKYVDSFPWATIQKEVKAMREDLDDEEESVADSPSTFPPSLTPIDGKINGTPPTPVQIIRLWQIFLERVNPVSKVVHVPSLQPIVVEATMDHNSMSLDTRALLFSIYSTATLSLTEAESQELLHCSKDQALSNFGAGVCIALTKAKFLQNYNMTTLQTLILYLVSLHGRADRHSLWILSGMLLRMSQKLGLHRDGDGLNLTPFESEMRRRIWWQIVLTDTKQAIASGFREPLLFTDWDTKFPSNVNDADLYPGFMEPIRPRDTPTEMAFVLVLCELCHFIIENRMTDIGTLVNGGHANVTNEATNGSSPPASPATFRNMILALDAKLQALEVKFIDPSINSLHLLASQIRIMIKGEMTCFFTPVTEIPEWGTEMFTAEDHVFRLLLVHLEHHFNLSEKMKNTNFQWFTEMHFEADAILYIASQLQRRHMGSLVDRCWVVLEFAFIHHAHMWDMRKRPNVKLGLATLKAWRDRERALLQAGVPVEVPRVVSMLQATVPITTPSPMPATQPAPLLNPEFLMDQFPEYLADSTNWSF